MKCKRCGSQQIKKNGKREGQQCYLCKECKHQFISEHGRHTAQEEQVAVLLYCFGLSFAVIGGILHVHPSTIMRWIRKYAKTNGRKQGLKGEIVIGLDDLWHFIRSNNLNIVNHVSFNYIRSATNADIIKET